MKEAVLIAAVAVLIAPCIVLLACAIKRRCCSASTDEEDANESLLSKDFSIGETLKRPNFGNKKEPRIEASATIVSRDSLVVPNFHERHSLPSSGTGAQHAGSSISLEVLTGPSAGNRLLRTLPEDGGLALSIGRISQNDLVLNDSEVSGKHAVINWNCDVSRWELVDLGSLNGTLLNHRSISISGPRRRRSAPVGLTSGDVLTLGSTSQILVHLSASKDAKFSVSSVPFGVGVAADAMTSRREKLSMEDVCHCEWPLRGLQQFGVFCIFDGHGGPAAAEAASRILPQKLSDILTVEGERIDVLTQCDAAKVLKDAFKETEEALNCEYEGCTATVLLLWSSVGQEYFVQCANLGDSSCVLSVGGKPVVLTEDHRLTSPTERARLLEMGRKLKDGETRICGMNIARALGDKFLKEEESCFSAEPYVSKVLKITKDSKGIVVMGSDGLWDVLSPIRAIQLAIEARDGRSTIDGRMPLPPMNAEEIAQLLVGNARLLKTKDNTSVIVLDFFPASATNNPSVCTL
ncbi:protein phosphatase 2C 70 isoform X1 [Selaginella moellendorffii]|uniref:protein phosphatase 2C 70 isoform X1 n=1 Tax=Selaginella moellendorffii TaxID=88036 RepID=UPI000D1D03FD|nr:protein phosphatase 2C 70 isoform X1 [Selaginella moellendorffii]|eukprot:XP_002970567.2 protein phosphatase 2C 70 isoform X1 [Selaginella moellendorffii]